MFKIPYLYIAILLVAVGCSDEKESSSGSPTPDSGGSVPTEAEITSLIQSGSYLSWFGHSTIQTAQSSGAHPRERTFVNTTLKTSMDANNTEHPVGSIAVKELYGGSDDTITGYAYSQKISTGTSGSSWLWYEDLNVSTSNVDFYGQGLSLCVGCHSAGTDHVRIQF